MIVLLALPLLLLAALARALSPRVGRLDAWVLGFVGLGCFWLASAAVLSLGGWFGHSGLAIAYVVAIGAVLPWCRRRGDRLEPMPWARLVRDPWVLVLAAEFAVLLVIAVSVAPNTFDSMAYHLPRVEQWLQAGEVGPFPATFAPQLYLPPLAEIAMAGFSALGDTVWAVNLVQLLAHAVTMVGVAALARNLGLDPRGQAIAAGVLGLMPLAVSEAVTTQNDYVTTAFVVAAYAVASRRAGERGAGPWWLTLTLVAAGLACATKPTAILFVAPALVWALQHLRGSRVRLAVPLAALGVAVAVLANLGWLADNEAIFDDPGGPPSALTNARVTPGVVVGNLVRNAGHELGTPVPAVNRATEAVLSTAIRAIGADPDDPDAIYGAPAYDVDSQRNEDRPANLLQGLLIAAACVVALVGRASRRRLLPLIASMAVGYLAFAVVLRWQVWGGRLLLPLLALGAVVLADWVRRWPGWLGLGLLAALTVQSLPWLLLQTYRPLIGPDSVLTTSPTDELFAGRPELREPALEAVRQATAEPGRRIGLAPSSYQWEYPLWWLVHRADPTARLGNAEPRYARDTGSQRFDVVIDPYSPAG